MLPSRNQVTTLFAGAALLLIVAWIPSIWGAFWGVVHSLDGKTEFAGGFTRGRMAIHYRYQFTQGLPGVHWEYLGPPLSASDVLGEMYVDYYEGPSPFDPKSRLSFAGIEIPVPCLLLIVASASLVAHHRCRYSIKVALIIVSVIAMTLAWYSPIQIHIGQ